MDEELKKTEEGGVSGYPGATSAPQPAPQLNSSPEPTEEELADAGMAPADPAEGGFADGAADVAHADEETPEALRDGAMADAPAGTDPGPVAVAARPVEERTFTQSQVNDLVGRTRMETREQTFRAVYGRYGVEDEAGMDELVGNAQRYETVRGEYDDAKKAWGESDAAKAAELKGLSERVALLESGIDASRYDDAKAIIGSKGLEVTVDSIKAELATHPEWLGAGDRPEPDPRFRRDPMAGAKDGGAPAQESSIRVLGNEGSPDSGGMSEEDYALKKLFKV